MWIKWILFSQMQNRGEESTTKIQRPQQHRTHREITGIYIYIPPVWGHYPIRSYQWMLRLNWIGAAAFEFVGGLTIELWVAVGHRWDSNQHLASVSLHHQLQLSAWLLDVFPRVAKRQVLRHRAVDLKGGKKEKMAVVFVEPPVPLIIIILVVQGVLQN